MYKYNILSKGENLRKIRKSLGIKQYELTSNRITSNLICMVEKNKAKLTTETAKIVVENINDVLKNKNMEKRIDVSDLIDCQENQVINIIDDITVKLNEDKLNSIDLINAAYKILNENSDVKSIVELYEKVGYALFLKKDYKNSYIFYVRTYDQAFKNNNFEHICNITNKLSRICYKLGRISEGIRFIDNVLQFKQFKIDDDYKLIFNKSKLLKLEEKYKESLDTLDKIDRISLTNEELFKVETLKANCYDGLKNYKEALKIHKQIYENIQINDLDKIIVLNNIIELCKKCNNSDINIRRYLDEIMDTVKLFENTEYGEYESLVFLEIAKDNLLFGDRNKGIEMIKKILEKCEKDNLTEPIIKAIEMLFDYYKNNSRTAINKLCNYFSNFISKNKTYEKSYNRLLLKFIKYYSAEKHIKQLVENVNL